MKLLRHSIKWLTCLAKNTETQYKHTCVCSDVFWKLLLLGWHFHDPHRLHFYSVLNSENYLHLEVNVTLHVKKKKKQTPEQTYIFGIQFTLLFDWQLWLCSNVPVTGWQTSIFLSYIRYKYFILLHLPTVSSSLNKASCNSCWIASVVPVIRVWLLGSSLWKSTSLSGIEVRKAVLLPVEVWALVQTDIRLRLHLLVPIPIGVVSATDTIQTYLMSDLISNA